MSHRLLNFLSGALLCAALPASAQVRFDFGSPDAEEKGYVAATAEGVFSPQTGYGWWGLAPGLARDRNGPDALRRDFIFGKTAQTFRVGKLTPGRYLLTVIVGDMTYGDHVTQIKIAGVATDFPLLEPAQGEFATLKASVTLKEIMDITFDSPRQNWVVNALSVEPLAANAPDVPPTVTKQRFGAASAAANWDAVKNWPDPTKALLETFKANAAKAPRTFKATGLKRQDYLRLMASSIDFWKTQQNAAGAIIDPYRKEEFQYSTPAFAHAAAALVVYANRRDLLEPAAKALDWSTRTLSRRQAATAHEDFYPPMIAHTIPLLKALVAPARAAQWESDIRGFDPFTTYRVSPSGNNWNLVAAAGEAMFQKMGLRSKEDKFVEASFAGQAHHFASPLGLYLEGPMAYDAFPRLWVSDLVGQGYDGPFAAPMAEVLRRGAITSLFMQSPWGELPAGHRSAHHQWNEAEQCVIYEVFAARALKDGDAQLAAFYKRGARLALSSMLRWVRPSGELQIVKNWVDPSKNHGYEGYSAHSQYNLLPLSMLAIAYHHAQSSEAVAELPAPADVGGFVLQVPELHKLFANAGGTYVEIDTNADHHYDATGLIRIHMPGVSPQLGPSDSIVKSPNYQIPAGSPSIPYTAIGAAWQQDGAWRRVGELSGEIEKRTVSDIEAAPGRVAFTLTYEGKLFGATRLSERYILTPGRVELSSELAGAAGPLRYYWPVLADDGRTQSEIKVEGNSVTVSQDGGKTAQSFTAPGAQSVRVEAEKYPNHNGWARLGVAEFPQGGKITLVIAAKN